MSKKSEKLREARDNSLVLSIAPHSNFALRRSASLKFAPVSRAPVKSALRSCPRPRGVPCRAPFRGLARTDAVAEIDRRQVKTRCRFETRRTDDPPPVDHWGERCGS